MSSFNIRTIEKGILSTIGTSWYVGVVSRIPRFWQNSSLVASRPPVEQVTWKYSFSNRLYQGHTQMKYLYDEVKVVVGSNTRSFKKNLEKFGKGLDVQSVGFLWSVSSRDSL